MYQRNVRLFKYEKYQILCAELFQAVKSFDEKLYICETCQKHFNKNEIPSQAVCNKMAFRSYTRWVEKIEKKNRKKIIFKRILFRKIAAMHGKGGLRKIKESICNIPIETANICSILPRPAVSNGLQACAKNIGKITQAKKKL